VIYLAADKHLFQCSSSCVICL